MSMAVLLFQAGQVRRISPSTRLMLHNAAVEIEGRMEHKDFRRSSKEIKVLEDMYNRILSHRTGITMKQLEAWCDEETYFGAKECLALNLADEIIPPHIEVVPETPKKRSKK
jgi:ATP-dependent protease ClpP protease subunit